MTIVESGLNLYVWLVGVVSWRQVELVGGIYGCGLTVIRRWVRLECIGVVSGCDCKEE